MRKTKQRNWILSLYNDNKFYVWIVIGVIVLSGVTIGMAIGESNTTPTVLPNDNVSSIPNNIEANTLPIKEKQNDIENNISSMKNSTKIVTSKKETETKLNKTEDNEIIEKEEIKQEEKKLVFERPIEGDILRDFSDNTLVYSNTLEEWISHTGVDILGEKAMPVKAIEAGTICDVKEDPRYGYTIIIDHGQGYKSIYCNLSTLDMAFVGKVVEKGQVISGIGDTALFEIKDEYHLHFEIIKDGKYINPLKIFTN